MVTSHTTTMAASLASAFRAHFDHQDCNSAPALHNMPNQDKTINQGPKKAKNGTGWSLLDALIYVSGPFLYLLSLALQFGQSLRHPEAQCPSHAPQSSLCTRGHRSSLPVRQSYTIISYTMWMPEWVKTWFSTVGHCFLSLSGRTYQFH